MCTLYTHLPYATNCIIYLLVHYSVYTDLSVIVNGIQIYIAFVVWNFERWYTNGRLALHAQFSSSFHTTQLQLHSAGSWLYIIIALWSCALNLGYVRL